MTQADQKDGQQLLCNFGAYPKDFFDLVIIDECHRGGANDESSWRDILEYFSPAVQLGLTATPKRKNNVDTYAYFGNPVYSYTLKEGINDGFLTPFRVVKIETNYDEYTLTADDKIIEGEAQVGDTFTYRDFGRQVIIEQIELHRVKQFIEEISDQKTIVFCAIQTHAAHIRDTINQLHYKKNLNKNLGYCERVTANEGRLGEQFLRDFQDNEKRIPTILTTSRKLSTGVDAPEIRNIVLLRPIDSMIEFKQIIGRGTRLFEGKDYFTIYDFVRAYENFNDPEWDGDPINETGDGTSKACEMCGEVDCICETSLKACNECGNIPCSCEKVTPQMIQIQLSDNQYRQIKATKQTEFLDASGKLISAKAYIQGLFGRLPQFFSTEEELRAIWSHPQSRSEFLDKLHIEGYTKEGLKGLQRVFGAEQSDLFDVLNYIAHHQIMLNRKIRVDRTKSRLKRENKPIQHFLNKVLKTYLKEGEEVLSLDRIKPLLELEYQGIQEAMSQLGSIEMIKDQFIQIQKELYAS